MRAEACGESSDPDLLLEAATWSKGHYTSIIQAAAEFADITAVAGPCFDHPYFGVQATMLQPAELARLAELLAALGNAAAGLASYVEAITDYLGLQQVASLSLSDSLQAILLIIGTIPADAADLPMRLHRKTSDKSLRLRMLAWLGLTSRRPMRRLTSTRHGMSLLFPCDLRSLLVFPFSPGSRARTDKPPRSLRP